jgi:predicted CopG family antitoxin
MEKKTISVDKKTYEKLLMRKLQQSQKEKRNVSWDEVFKELLGD